MDNILIPVENKKISIFSMLRIAIFALYVAAISLEAKGYSDYSRAPEWAVDVMKFLEKIIPPSLFWGIFLLFLLHPIVQFLLLFVYCIKYDIPIRNELSETLFFVLFGPIFFVVFIFLASARLI